MMRGMNVSIADKEKISSFVGALFALPFILFLTHGGYFADRFSKRSVTIAVKLFEFVVVGIACIGLAGQDRTILLAGIFLMACWRLFLGHPNTAFFRNCCRKENCHGATAYWNLEPTARLFREPLRRRSYINFLARVNSGPDLCSWYWRLRVLGASPGARRFRVNFPADLFRRPNRVRKDRLLALAFAGDTYFSFVGCVLLLNLFFYGTYVLQLATRRSEFLTSHRCRQRGHWLCFGWKDRARACAAGCNWTFDYISGAGSCDLAAKRGDVLAIHHGEKKPRTGQVEAHCSGCADRSLGKYFQFFIRALSLENARHRSMQSDCAFWDGVSADGHRG
jgi:hypothetical protein